MESQMRRFLIIVLALLSSLPAYAQPAIDHVNSTNTVRCGYVEYNPGLVKDLQTSRWTRYDYEITKAVGERLQLKVDYTAPTGWATVVPDLKTGKFDVLCSGFWVHPFAG